MNVYFYVSKYQFHVKCHPNFKKIALEEVHKEII